MSDLISRSELLESFRKSYCGHLGMENSDSMITFRSICRIINKQPTAYDIDKVVEELKELEGIQFDGENESYQLNWCIETNRAIEIVKQGAVSDDVCKWKQTSTAKYKTSCGYKLEEYFDTNACYCKQCGKKIKVV